MSALKSKGKIGDTMPAQDAWIYEVALEVDQEVRKDFEEWILPHIERVLKTGCFLKAEFLKEEVPFSSYVVRYYCNSREMLEAYFQGPAQTLRAEGARFGSAMRSRRKILCQTWQAP